MQMFFEAVKQQALCRADGTVPEFDAYIEMRRETSGCKPVFDLIEYSLDLELPDAVVEHPVIVALNNGANDLVTWSNVSARPESSPSPIPICQSVSGLTKERPPTQTGSILVQRRAISRRHAQHDLRLYD
jgi:hypothetical protein